MRILQPASCDASVVSRARASNCRRSDVAPELLIKEGLHALILRVLVMNVLLPEKI